VRIHYATVIKQTGGNISCFKQNLSLTPASINHILKSLQKRLAWIKLENYQVTHLELELRLTY